MTKIKNRNEKSNGLIYNKISRQKQILYTATTTITEQ